MTDQEKNIVAPAKKLQISVDTWAVALALALAAIVRLGILPAVKW